MTDQSEWLEKGLELVDHLSRLKWDEGVAYASRDTLTARRIRKQIEKTEAELRAHLSLRAVPQGDVAEPDTRCLSEINELAKVYASSYASPHHITFTVAGLRAMLSATPPAREALLLAKDALELGRDAALQVAAEYHASMKGYRPAEHAMRDAEVEQIRTAIAAINAALEAK